jgi:hypothetical protein
VTEQKAAHGSDVLIAYVDQSDETKDIEVVPCVIAEGKQAGLCREQADAEGDHASGERGGSGVDEENQPVRLRRAAGSR